MPKQKKKSKKKSKKRSKKRGLCFIEERREDREERMLLAVEERREVVQCANHIDEKISGDAFPACLSQNTVRIGMGLFAMFISGHAEDPDRVRHGGRVGAELVWRGTDGFFRQAIERSREEDGAPCRPPGIFGRQLSKKNVDPLGLLPRSRTSDPVGDPGEE